MLFYSEHSDCFLLWGPFTHSYKHFILWHSYTYSEQTINIPISRWPALPPEPQPLPQFLSCIVLWGHRCVSDMNPEQLAVLHSRQTREIKRLLHRTVKHFPLILKKKVNYIKTGWIMSRGDTLFAYMVLCIQYRGHYGLRLEKKKWRSVTLQLH